VSKIWTHTLFYHKQDLGHDKADH